MAVSSKPLALIDDHVSLNQCTKAVTALLKHARLQQGKEEAMQLLPGKEQHVWLVTTVKRMRPHMNLKPQRIPLEHPLVDPRETAVCLITKDPQREYKDLLEANNIKFISRVVGIEKLKGKFKGFDARRLLLRENDLFLADDRVIPLLPKLLGKEWFKAKKQPIPVSLKKKDLKAELEKAISSTYMHQNLGTCTSIKIATISHKESQVVSNLKAAIPAVVARIDGGWDNIQSLNIKTSTSVSLPIWTCPLGRDEPGSRWQGMDIDEESEWIGLGSNAEDGGPSPKISSTEKKGDKLSPSENPSNKFAKSIDMPPYGNSKGKGKKRTADMVANEEKGPKKRKEAENELVSTPLEGKALDEAKSQPEALDALTSLTEPPAKKAKEGRRLKAANTPVSPKTNGSNATVVTAEELKEKKVNLTDAKAEKKKRKAKSSLKPDPKALLIGRKKLS